MAFVKAQSVLLKLITYVFIVTVFLNFSVEPAIAGELTLQSGKFDNSIGWEEQSAPH
ncbi:hypothetical protein Q9L42_019240 [Methylomarinum sp. Ch1-1]|uniref:Uncharacterized protein n=1 Tax=Methylomarinum roseum TaxID=3067653 RepID=A0AAU7NTZ3_9GAMM|nr:hypothetical protein [Methylomarinum sp. Ch1-1]MDP4519471.1 hypothetical protein [Methylomarinum sp. Ch1-1]